ncbi:MAG: pyruvate:ferredoxin (flavodoxin) oxidoreductase [Ilumatobacter sp.]|uniref:pyruvate:ferredoxin (flavodoxin) oxidoreductase n=1 Tax=Ilumatobacter sp. TaxID=1967498 RepID=UPI002626CA35|nr:pyruvate:ferredoxin (flavodoxin) oxidoreductase [Ilumatobacter sp.]MDJ0768278.1 pyruvate:ferredoxin (flavodoxin) oxidoreductase [Ilumatobacter sp.]
MTAACIDGNEAASRVAYALSEVVAIYPITPASPMGESADAWAAADQPNVWGSVPDIVEMQSEAGAAGALHGALQAGSLATTFTASQGLLLMLPNMFKIAGELSPAVIHVAARAVATHALSIFGEHSDVMAARTTGFSMLAASSVQEAHDFAAVAHAATLRSRVPFLHFFDGFRTSHEINRIELLDDDHLRSLVRDDDIAAHRLRRLRPTAPLLRGTAQNPDVFFQGREASNSFYDAVPGTVAEVFAELEALTGRRYGLVDYEGAPDAERVIVMMGSGAGAAGEAVAQMSAAGERVGLVTIRLFRPFPTEAFVAALPDSVQSIVVLDRTKEPGAVGEPLLQDVVTTLADAGRGSVRVIGGRYGLGSKEFTPAMAKAAFDEAANDAPRRRFTVGIVDDVTGLSLPVDDGFRVTNGNRSAVFYALGSDGTVGANKASVKIIGSEPDLEAQGYFVYDSKKSGSMTVSHLRYGPEHIRSTYLIDDADLVACHQFGLLDRFDVLESARPGGTFLLNAPYPADEVWDHLPRVIQQEIIDKGLRVFTIDAAHIARELGMPGRINTVMQPCFFALAEVMDIDRAVDAIKTSIEKVYGRRGSLVVERNHAAVDRALGEMTEVAVPATMPEPSAEEALPLPTDGAGDFVERVTATMIAGRGDLLPVSALPVDGTFPTATTQYEKRKLAAEIPIWEPDLCIDCGKCAIVCPHAAIRLKAYEPATIADAPDGFPTKKFRSREIKDHSLTVQVAPDDCTGCGICVDVCPAKDKTEAKRKSINMRDALEHRDHERERWDYFLTIPELDRTAISHDNVKNSQLLQPLFEFSGACSGCGETPYVKLLTQLFGDRLVVANATGCSSIYGGNLPTTPWAKTDAGLGPAWSNSLFEDNAEFGLGMRLGIDQHQHEAARLVDELAGEIGPELATALLANTQPTEADVFAQRERVAELRTRLAEIDDVRARRLDTIADELVRTSTWIVGGDGWAYDIGYGGVDHVLGTGRNVNLLVLDTEVYSNTGGQASKATPLGAVAKFATAGKPTSKKDLGAIARSYGNVYVAQVALGGSDVQTVKAFCEADAWDGPSLIIAYSTCIAHGIDMETSMAHQKLAVRSGYWPLYRYRPSEDEHEHPFQLDSAAPTVPLREFALKEARYAMLARSDPARSEHLLDLAQANIDERWKLFEQFTDIERAIPHLEDEDEIVEIELEPGEEGVQP